MHLSKIVGMESWITIEASTIQIQLAQLFLSVLIQFLTSNDWDARITICLCPDCRRTCLDMKYPVQFARISRPESINQHSFLELVIVQMNLGTFIQNFFQIITGKMWINFLCRIEIPEYPVKDNVLCFQRKFIQMMVIISVFFLYHISNPEKNLGCRCRQYLPDQHPVFYCSKLSSQSSKLFNSTNFCLSRS